MSILVRLNREHTAALENLALLGVTLQGLESGSLAPLSKKRTEILKNVGKISRFFEKDLSFHFEMEEKYIFPRLESIAGIDRGFISGLLTEHERLRKKLSTFQQLAKTGVKDERAKKKLVRISREIIKSLSPHARKENHKLLPLAKRVLDEKQLRDISQIVREIVKERGIA